MVKRYVASGCVLSAQYRWLWFWFWLAKATTHSPSHTFYLQEEWLIKAHL